MKLSILIPTVPERFAQAAKLIEKLEKQNVEKQAEILWFGDNRARTIGAKRNALLDAARGQYAAFVDDDDDVSDDYITSICSVQELVDVITFDQHAVWNGEQSTVEFSIQHSPAGQFVPGGTTKRFPWHSCAWRRDLATKGVFTEKNWGEDLDWVLQVHRLPKREARIPRVLHYYRHHDAQSLALDNVLRA
jgi:glycosyltransferase involved in cell wall biosynthesis